MDLVNKRFEGNGIIKQAGRFAKRDKAEIASSVAVVVIFSPPQEGQVGVDSVLDETINFAKTKRKRIVPIYFDLGQGVTQNTPLPKWATEWENKLGEDISPAIKLNTNWNNTTGGVELILELQRLFHLFAKVNLLTQLWSIVATIWSIVVTFIAIFSQINIYYYLGLLFNFSDAPLDVSTSAHDKNFVVTSSTVPAIGIENIESKTKAYERNPVRLDAGSMKTTSIDQHSPSTADNKVDIRAIDRNYILHTYKYVIEECQRRHKSSNGPSGYVTMTIQFGRDGTQEKTKRLEPIRFRGTTGAICLGKSSRRWILQPRQEERRTITMRIKL